ncbi:putative Histidine kinase [Candidatus Terasakiella magnetica]|uniref:histidine kinase n=1 Tax=Candidatus Terasakiella magnetica TaxID=1867952 RepID=A0A1C3RDA0_9PROT|nr:ATP-binding protein [Candidatus Terasakiella magnetica]SCA55256.1 putative Histidine kinase [Candidatus Terasakiella magnetica]
MFFFTTRRLRLAILAPFTLILLVVVGLFIGSSYIREEKLLTSSFETTLKQVESQYKQSIESDVHLMHVALHSILENNDIRARFVEKDFQTLFQLSQPIFKRLRKNHQITHFYFITPDRKTFLRVHQKDRHSDTIDRLTLLNSEKTGGFSHGLELGKFGTFTLRAVMPWYQNGTLIGYVEIGEEIDHITRDIAQRYDLGLIATIKKEILNKFDWQVGQNFVDYTVSWDDFDDLVIVGKQNVELNRPVKEFIRTTHSNVQTSQARHFTGQNSELLMQVLPLKDYGQNKVGQLFVMQDITAETAEFSESIKQTTIASLLGGAVVFIIYFVILGRAQSDIRGYTNNLAKAKSNAEVANKAKSEFLASMSHELRTPMTGILGFAELILKDDIPDEAKDKIIKIRSSGSSLLNLLNDILDMSKLEAGKMEVEQIDFNLHQLVGDIVGMFEKTRSTDTPLDSELTFDKAIPKAITSDPTKLKQILTNLLGNAYKFTREGKVSIACENISPDNNKPYVKFTITDSGIGMNEETLDCLFNEFTQADASISRKFEGTGLGLAISKHLIELLGGEITAHSQLGKGSTFTFTLPYEKAKETALPEQKANATAKDYKAQKSLKILLAEDNRVNQLLIKNFLAAYGHEVSVADNGAKAVEAYEQEEFDIILMDVRMPEMDGIEATQIIRQMPAPKNDICILAVTADAMKDNVETYLQAGMNSVVIKPLNWVELITEINHQLDEEIHVLKEPA